jgi:hypothetical protein
MLFSPHVQDHYRVELASRQALPSRVRVDYSPRVDILKRLVVGEGVLDTSDAQNYASPF